MKLLEIRRLKGSLGIIHFVGIGGIGMSGIAEILHLMGYMVQGSDLSDNYNTKRLKEYGVKIFNSHIAENVNNVEYVVTSTAIKADNPEVIEAKKLGIPVIKRSEMLAELMRLKTCIAVSGTHGKTTTTTLVSTMFEAAGLNPTVINGGIINNRSTNAYIGQGDFLVAEADESDATFIQIPSTVAVITNIDPEHLDFYGNFENVKAAFKSFITNLPFYGFAVACLDHPEVKILVSSITNRKVITYGLDSEEANIYGFNVRTDTSGSVFDVSVNLPHAKKSYEIKDIRLPTPGIHNVLNSLAAIAIAAEMEFPNEVIQNGFASFSGVKRRFTHIADLSGVTIIDDYAHHPAEINATLKTARLLASARGKKVIAVFQPHRYSRVESLFEDFQKCFHDADIVYIADIYAAGEQPIGDLSNKKLVDSIKANHTHKDTRVLNSPDDLPSILNEVATSGDIMIFMGAGTITQWANQLPEKCFKIETPTISNIITQATKPL
ncbi:MAG: murC [Rickettsiaceae bacterium]|jgi:UDP-N-acetylmuramate--alanine ligase|nr:murC [Rickettsiaceae bacterium]